MNREGLASESSSDLASDLASVPAWRSTKAWITLLLVLVLALGVDLWTKSEAFASVAGFPVVLEPREVVSDTSYRIPWHNGVRAISPDLLDFHLVINHGAVFGIGQNARGVFIVFTLIAVAAGVFIFGWWTRARATWAHIAIGLILAGGIGNLYDRMTFGAVRDFAWPLVTLDIHCAKGVYVRSLARDLGRALGTGGHCFSIRRTWSAPFSIDNAIPLDSLPNRLGLSDLTRVP